MSVVPIDKKITTPQKEALANSNSIELPMLLSFFAVEGAGIGFSDYTGLMLIQFEPLWMKYFAGHQKPEGSWINNGVCNQTKEYIAFNEAKQQNIEAAMKSTSIGIGQIMGFHYERIGFGNVHEMWAFANTNEFNQASMVISFIKTDPILYAAVKNLDMTIIAERYNGKAFRELANKLHIVPYDIQLRKAYDKFKSNIPVCRTTTSVNIRTGSGINFSLAGKPLAISTPVEVLNQKDGWSKVEVITTGLKGWIKSDFLK